MSQAARGHVGSSWKDDTVQLRRLLAGMALVAALAGCNRAAGDQARFCADVESNREAIVTAPATANEIDDFIGLYKRIGESAPLAIDDQWDALIHNYETASTVEPGDPESVQRVVALALRTERSALAVRDWLLANCEVDIGEVATMAGSQTPPPPTSVPGD